MSKIYYFFSTTDNPLELDRRTFKNKVQTQNIQELLEITVFSNESTERSLQIKNFIKLIQKAIK